MTNDFLNYNKQRLLAPSLMKNSTLISKTIEGAPHTPTLNSLGKNHYASGAEYQNY